MTYFQRSLLVAPTFLAARENLDNLCSQTVDRWHFRMLNDKKRNIGYQCAIERAVRGVLRPQLSSEPDGTQMLEAHCAIGNSDRLKVLDIGAGTGLLRYVGFKVIVYVRILLKALIYILYIVHLFITYSSRNIFEYCRATRDEYRN